MTFNTGNNVPSTDPRDLYDNAENLDNLVNGADPFYADRLGKLRESWSGMENSFNNAQEGRETAFTLSQADKESRFQAFLVSSGYVSKGDYAANVVLAERNEYVAVDAATTGTTAGLYRPGPGATLPLTLTGTWATDSANLVLLGDDVLRQELAQDGGAALVGGALITVNTVADMLSLDAFSLQAGRQVSVREYLAGTGFGGGIYYWSPSTPAASHNGGTVISAAADFPSDWTLEAQQTAWFTPGTSGEGCWIAIHEDSIEASRFGADYSGTIPSDLSLLAALQYSAATSVEVTTSGKVRLLKTLNQPRDSIFTGNGLIFCEDPAALTDGWLWRVLGADSVSTKTEIRRLVLSTYPFTTLSSASAPGRPMKGLQVSTAHVRIGDVDTYGFQLAGVELGPSGYEIIAGNITCNVAKWATASPGAVGFKLSTSDSAVDNVVVSLYPIGAQLGSANHIGNIHVWGMPATPTGIPEQVMFTGVIFGRESSVDYLYVDTHDTAAYDTVPSGNNGVGVVFNDERNHIGSLNFLIHGSTKPNKLKLIRYGAAYNMIDHLAVGLGSPSYDKVAPIVYTSPSFIWLNRIDKTAEQSHVNTFTYTSGMPIAGVSAYTGTLRLEKVGGTLSIALYNQITGYSAASSSPVDLTLPSGLTMRQGVLGVTSVSSCFNVPQAAVMPMTVSPNIVRFYFKNTDTGLKSTVLQSTLRTGELEFSLSVPLAFP